MEQDSNDTGVVSYGQCIRCDENCQRCNENSAYCTSCRSGFTLSTSRTCMPLNQFNFTVLLSLDLATFTSKMSNFRSEIAKLINDTSVKQAQRQKFLQIKKVSTGSIKVEGTMSASSAQAIDKTKQNFEKSFAVGSKFAGIEVLSSETSTINYDTSQNGNEWNSQSRTKIIVGVIVGVVCVIILAVVIVICVMRYRKRKAAEGQIGYGFDKKTGTTRDDNIVSSSIGSEQGLNVQKMQKVTV